VLPLGALWNVTRSARNRTSISNLDRLLDGDHVFSRLNPAVGVTFNPSRAVTLYAGYSEGSRAPTSIELGCADPNQPCKLPNAWSVIRR
jgi:outer membrane receptor protein involved in Fe transport